MYVHIHISLSHPWANWKLCCPPSSKCHAFFPSGFGIPLGASRDVLGREPQITQKAKPGLWLCFGALLVDHCHGAGFNTGMWRTGVGIERWWWEPSSSFDCSSILMFALHLLVLPGWKQVCYLSSRVIRNQLPQKPPGNGFNWALNNEMGTS